jgi:hypothetical protein
MKQIASFIISALLLASSVQAKALKVFILAGPKSAAVSPNPWAPTPANEPNGTV